MTVVRTLSLILVRASIGSREDGSVTTSASCSIIIRQLVWRKRKLITVRRTGKPPAAGGSRFHDAEIIVLPVGFDGKRLGIPKRLFPRRVLYAYVRHSGGETRSDGYTRGRGILLLENL